MIEQLGRYEIIEEIGRGGFAIVYRGRDTELDRLVALKELRPTLLQDKSWIRRFRREARTIARLDHPAIVPIYDVYEANDRLFIVMRLVEGASLEDVLTTRGALPWTEALEIFTTIAGGLEHAHAQGILHRDLKPANILMDQNRGPLLSDFGLAKLAGEASMATTAGGGVVGTPHYIAPEVWEGKGTSEQSDIYALGCILFEMLTGEKVFKGDTPPAVMMAHFKPPVLPRAWPNHVPPGIEAVLKTALAQKPAERYKTVPVMAAALTTLPGAAPADVFPPVEAERPPAPAPQSEPLVQQQPPPMVEPPPIEPELPASAAAPAPQTYQPGPDRGQRRGWGGCLIISGIVAIGLMIVVVLGAGTLCSAVGTTVENVFATVEIGPRATREIRAPLPDTSNPVTVGLNFRYGQLNIKPGAKEALIEGVAAYNVEALEPQVEINDDEVTLRAREDIGLAGLTTSNIQNEWNLSLANRPINLTIDATGAGAEVELGGLSVVDLTVNQGAANFNLSFSEPNQVDMDQLQFAGGASNATLTGLSNARARDIDFQGGAGNYILDFSGDMRESFEVKIEAGLGAITLIVPEDTAAEVVFEGKMANINASGAWQQVGDNYVLAGSGPDAPKISIDINMGPGSVELRNP